MGQSLSKRGYITAGALSFILMALVPNKCSGNPIELGYPPPPAPDRMVEIAGMAATYQEGQPWRILGFVVNEYEYEDTAAVIGLMRLGSFRLGDDSRRIVRQSVCFDNNVPVRQEVNVVLPKLCKERDPNEIINSEKFTIVMIEQVIRESPLHRSATFEYRYTENENDLLDFDLQLRPYDVENQWSEDIVVRRPDWDCTMQTSGRSECYWQPEDEDKRMVFFARNY